jgi:pyruvate kinase
MKLTRTKIVATVGPACGTRDCIAELVKAGVDVFRLNFSHGTKETHAEFFTTIREVAAESGACVAVMQDLQGPRIRTGRLGGRGSIDLKQGSEVRLRPGDFPGDAGVVPVNYAALPADVSPDDRLLLKDGLIELVVVAVDGDDVVCTVEVGGILTEHQGMNLPGVDLSIVCPTEKDIADLHLGLDLGVDYVALSFVRSADDIGRLKEEIAMHGGPAVPVVAKIEKPEAVQNLDAILRLADGVMVARGDLGIEIPTEVVPVTQKRIIAAANRRGVPVITATQMLESMVRSPRPTRAEASDVANAILDGTDAVMLSGETSVGIYPVRSVRTMDSIARHIEQIREQHAQFQLGDECDAGMERQQALASAACDIARRVHAAGIVTFTITGSTARTIAQRRPDTPIYALTPEERTFRRLALVWGVHPVLLDRFESTDEMVQQGESRLRELGLVEGGETAVYVAGASTNTPGGTDMLKIHEFRSQASRRLGQ